MNTLIGKLGCAGSLLLATVCGLGNSAWAQSAAANTPAHTHKPSAAPSEPSKGEKQAEMWFKMLDSNGDNHLSWNEVKHISPLAKDFKTADTDGNGLVSREEVRVLSRQRVAERRARKAREAAAKAKSESASQGQFSPAPTGAASRTRTQAAPSATSTATQ